MRTESVKSYSLRTANFGCLIALVGALSGVARSQSTQNELPTAASAIVAAAQAKPSYSKPTERAKFRNYIFDAVGPYPILGAAAAAGIGQATNNVPEWGQGAEGYGRRFGSNLGIVAVSTTTRYALAAALREDTLYYRCECTGVLPRLKHALVTSLAARRGDDGHQVFSLPALVAPYAGTTTAVYAWYPDRFGAKDAFRLGNYNLLAYIGSNIALEFVYGGPHTLLSKLHLGDRHEPPVASTKL